MSDDYLSLSKSELKEEVERLKNENRNLVRLITQNGNQVKELRVELFMTKKQLSEYALIVGAARKVAAGFGVVTTPDEDALFDLIEKYFMQVK